MKKFLLLVLSLVLFISCCDGEKHCPAFDFTSAQMDWALFPEDKEVYNFTSSTGELISFNKVEYEATDEYLIEDISCFSFNGKGTCSIKLDVEYFSDDLSIEIKDRIALSDDDLNKGSSSFTVAIGDSAIDIRGEIYDDELEDYISFGSYIDSIEIEGILYRDVLSLASFDNSNNIYISKGLGLVGLTIDGVTYILQ